ncbi:ectonucleotide pyrophosphatase/phosphodiesterase [Novosphingobium sp. PS1R-30]|uniref:Ectonucleotide pyrophosphatase/phosphodiesterase n=2 Tax=Novosphingobium anseongense TaxID=3133436 RepID=A0ABU8RQ70_9SPHN
MMRAALLLAAGLAVSTPALAEPVLLISIDGLRPGDVIEAEQRGLRIPNLRRFVTEGAYATGVVGVLPTVTYPSHTTLVTGASPAKHGIVSNNTFDPRQINQGGWYWYASDIKVPTLWSAAGAAGKSVGSIHWPVSVAATGVTWNLPQIWRTGHADDVKLVAALSTPGLVPELERATGEAYAAGIDESIDGDEKRGRFAIKLIEAHKPEFLTVYYTALDHEQHAQGPGTPQAHAVLERIDAVIGKVIAAELAAHPDAVIAVASDHGFETISRETSLHRPFIDAGLITLDDKGAIKAWDAVPWIAGGSAAVVLARPDDAALQAKVAKLLADLKADPTNGIAAVIGKDEIARMGGNPEATFYVNMMPDATLAGFAGASAPLRGTPKYHGTHGYFPQAKNLRSTFLIMGKGVPAGRSLGEIDMRAIAPTLAQVLGVELGGAEVSAIRFDAARK